MLARPTSQWSWGLPISITVYWGHRQETISANGKLDKSLESPWIWASEHVYERLSWLHWCGKGCSLWMAPFPDWGPRLSKWKRKLSRGLFPPYLTEYTMLPATSRSRCLDFPSRLTRDFLVPKSFFPRVSLIWVFHCKKSFFKKSNTRHIHLWLKSLIWVLLGIQTQVPRFAIQVLLPTEPPPQLPSAAVFLVGACWEL